MAPLISQLTSFIDRARRLLQRNLFPSRIILLTLRDPKSPYTLTHQYFTIRFVARSFLTNIPFNPLDVSFIMVRVNFQVSAGVEI